MGGSCFALPFLSESVGLVGIATRLSGNSWFNSINSQRLMRWTSFDDTGGKFPDSRKSVSGGGGGGGIPLPVRACDGVPVVGRDSAPGAPGGGRAPRGRGPVMITGRLRH